MQVAVRKKKSTTLKTNQKGRQPDDILQNAFSKTCEWLEMETDLVTVKVLQEKTIQFFENNSTYTTKYLKKLLKEKYGAYLFFSEATRESNNVICFQDMANYIINNKLKDK